MTATPGMALDAARSQLGVTDGPGRDTGYLAWLRGETGRPDPAEARWAAAFCAWTLAAAGADPDDTGRYAHCTPWMEWFRARGRLAHTPVAGALVFYDWDEDGAPEHMGIVEARRDDGRLITIEGDTDPDDGRGVRVARMVRAVRGVAGYGLPFYGPAHAYRAEKARTARLEHELDRITGNIAEATALIAVENPDDVDGPAGAAGARR